MYSLYTAGIASLPIGNAGPSRSCRISLAAKRRGSISCACGASFRYPRRLLPALLHHEVGKKNFGDLAALQQRVEALEDLLPKQLFPIDVV